MAKARRVVRKVQPGGARYFDEQLWPICIALVVLGAFLMGISAAYLPLAGAPWHRTAWPSLIAIPLVVAGFVLAFRYIDSRLIRRSMQLSIVLCAIVHVALVLHLVETKIFGTRHVATREPAEIIERRPPKVLREYHPSQLLPDEDRPRQDYERPVETATPEPTREPEQIVRQPTEQDRSPPEPQPVPVPEQMRTVEPNVVNRQVPNEAAPRLAAQPSQLSRQVRPSDARTSQTVETPQVAPPSPASIAAQPRSEPLARQQTQAAADAPRVEAPSATSEAAQPRVARRTDERAPTADSTATPTLPRSLADPAATPRTQVAAAERPSPARETAPDALAPANTSAIRRQTTSPQIAERSVEPLPEPAREPATQPQRRELPLPNQPQIAEATATAPRRQPAALPDPASTAAASPQATPADTTATSTSVAAATPRASSVRRTAAEVASPTGSRAGPATANAESGASAREPAAASLARATSRAAAAPSPVASVDPSAAPGGVPRRALASAPAERSPTAVDSPAAALASAGAGDPAAQPAPTAISRSVAGTAGAARSPNLDNALPATQSPSLVASGAARRAESTQHTPPGDALSPSAPATIARSQAGANIPTATHRAEAVEVATTPGSAHVADVTASSSAALTRADAAARSDAITAARGTGEIDLGPTQVVSEAGIGRASGGGQPQPSFSASQPLARQSTAGGAPLASLAAADVGDVAAPAGAAGGAPPQAEPTAVAAGIARTAAASPQSGGGPAGIDDPDDEEAGPSAAPQAASLARATAGGGLPDLTGLPTAGGTDRPARQAAGPTFSANVVADEIALAGAPQSSGSPRGAPLEAQGIETARLAAGAAGPAIDRPLGTVRGPEAIDADRTALAGDRPGRRQLSPTNEDGPSIGDLAMAGSPTARPAAPAMIGSTTVENIPEVGPMSAVAQAELDHALPGAAPMPMSRQSGEAIAVSIEAPDGPGGLGTDFTPEVGVNARQARQDSLDVQLRSARFVRTEVGGLPSVSTAAIVASDAFSSRAARVRGDVPAGGSGTPSPQTEAAIERGLAFLARYQRPDGSWSLQGFAEEAQLASDTAATALAVLAFQGAGYNHREFQYKDVVRAGLEHLVKGQKENGDLFVPLDDLSNRSVWLYSHSLAAIALCEAYGMTQDPSLREPAQQAIDFIVASQHADRGGWRYSPGVSSDTSVSGWMMMALKSGELAGLDVPQESYRKIDRWLDQAKQSSSEPYLFRYNPYAPDTPEQRHGLAASKTMTSVGLLMRLYGGWKRDNHNMQRGAQFLAANLPASGTPREPLRDTYYWYYATQVMAHMGGDYWQAWNSRLHPLLVNSQVQYGPYAGSWDPRGSVPDRWGPHAGRLYVTTMNLLSLEVQYRKLPLYEDTIR